MFKIRTYQKNVQFGEQQHEMKDVFTGLGCVLGLHHIQINPEVAPVSPEKECICSIERQT